MAQSAGTLRVWRYFAALAGLLAVLYGIVFWPGQPRTPKLGLDLEGGAQVVYQAKPIGAKAPSKAAMNQARQIITSRVNGLGVSSAEVVIQGSDRIVVSIPGKRTDDITNVGSTALLYFRPVIAGPLPVAAPGASPAAPKTTTKTVVPSGPAKPSGTAKPSVTAKPPASVKPTTSASVSPSPRGRVLPHLAPIAAPAPATPIPSGAAVKTATTPTVPKVTPSVPAPSSNAGGSAPGEPVDQFAKLGFTPPTNAAALQALPAPQQQALQALIQAWDCQKAKNDRPLDLPNKPLISCDEDGQSKYLLAPVIVPGTEIKSAAARGPGSSQGQVGWTISLDLKDKGQAAWADYTAKHNETVKPQDTANIVAFTLDSQVIVAPATRQAINGSTEISGNFNETTATALANSLKYGALPLTFEQKTSTTITPTLGIDQLKAGLLAGGIGLALVVVYSLIYYRALGLVTIASLMVSGALTYAFLVILGKQIGFTLTLAGIAGFIVAIGITADSFVVFFERIKDEIHEGRSSRVAIPRAWTRSRRTILTADTVSFLAAATLYYFAAGEVKGFAFTLGLSTILDLVVVFLFTHPLVSLFSRSAAFGSARFTGLNTLRPALATGQSVSTEFSAPSKPAVPSTPADLGKPTESSSTGAPSKRAKQSPASAAERAAARRGLAKRDSGEANPQESDS